MLTNIRTPWFRITWLLAGASCLTQGSACSDDNSGEQKGTAVAEAGSSSGKAGQGARAGAGGKNAAKAGASGAAGKPSDGDDEKDKEKDSARAGDGAGGAGGKAGDGKAAAGSGGRDAEANQGGKSASAGKGGNSSGGTGGSSGMSMTMGEYKESAECVACEMKPPSTDPVAAQNCTGGRVDNCMKMPGRAMGGALVGEKRSTLCLNLVACMHATKCAYATTPDSATATDCFCGTGVDPAACKEKPLAELKGACKAEFAAAAEADDPKMVIDSALDTSIAVGSAVALLEVCDDFFCPVCHGGPSASGAGGSSGMSGGQAGMSAAGMSAAGQSGSAGAP